MIKIFRFRYLAVTQPLIYSRRRRSKRLAGLMIVAVWILAGAITSPPLLGCFPRATNRDSKKCSYNMDSSYVIFSAMGSFFLPMLVMLYVYGRISCVIAGRHRNLEATETENVRPRRNVLVSMLRLYLNWVFWKFKKVSPSLRIDFRDTLGLEFRIGSESFYGD